MYAEKDGRYTLLLDVTCNELTYEVGPFVAASLKASVTNSKGDALCSYSKKYARAGAKDMDAAYARAVYKIQEDLRENFFAE